MMRLGIVILLISLVPSVFTVKKKGPIHEEELPWINNRLITDLKLPTPHEYFDQLMRSVLTCPVHPHPIESFIGYRLESELVKLFHKGKKALPDPLPEFIQDHVVQFFSEVKNLPFSDGLNCVFDWFNGEFIAWLVKVPEIRDYTLDGYSMEEVKLELSIQVFFHYSARLKAKFVQLMGVEFLPKEVFDLDQWMLRSVGRTGQLIEQQKETFGEFNDTVAFILTEVYGCAFQRADFSLPERGYMQHCKDFPETTAFVKELLMEENPRAMRSRMDKYAIKEYFVK